MLAREQAISEFAILPQRYNLLVQEHTLPYQSTQRLKKKTSNAISTVPTWARTHETKASPRTLGGRVAEEASLVIAAALSTALLYISA